LSQGHRADGATLRAQDLNNRDDSIRMSKFSISYGAQRCTVGEEDPQLQRSISRALWLERVIGLNQDRRRLLWLCQTNHRNRPRQLCGQPLGSLQPMFRHCLTRRPLSLALSGDAEFFEQLLDARVEDVSFIVLLRGQSGT
jgi:hypothetical protein